METATPQEIVDATVIDEGASASPEPSQAPPAAPAQGPSAGTDLVLAPAGAGSVIAAYEPEEILAKAQQIAAPLAKLIETAGLSVSLDKRNPDRKHVEVGGWQAAGTMLGALGGQALHAETVWTRPARDPATGQAIRRTYTAEVKRYFKKDEGGGLRETVTYEVDGYDWEACVEIRTPSGVVVGRAEAMCSRSESTWSKRDEYAVRSMAETRAESRAYRRAIGWIVHMAGYNPTPAEEMGHTPGADTGASAAPDWALEASRHRKVLALDSLTWLLGNSPTDRETAKLGLAAVKEALGLTPEGIAVALSRIAKVVQDRSGEASPAPAQATPEPSPPSTPATAEPTTEAEATAAIAATQAQLSDEELQAQKRRAYGESDAAWLARLRGLGCDCPQPFEVQGQKATWADTCPLHGAIKF